MSDIKCLKLISGEEVIGNLVVSKEGSVELKDVAAVMMMPSQSGNGSVSLGLMPFLPYADTKSIVFARASIVVEFDPNLDMINNYNRMFGSGIQIAKSL